MFASIVYFKSPTISSLILSDVRDEKSISWYCGGLELASEFLHDFFSLIVLAGKTRIQAGAKFQKERGGAVGKEFGIAEGQFGHEERALRNEGICEAEFVLKY